MARLLPGGFMAVPFVDGRFPHDQAARQPEEDTQGVVYVALAKAGRGLESLTCPLVELRGNDGRVGVLGVVEDTAVPGGATIHDRSGQSARPEPNPARSSEHGAGPSLMLVVAHPDDDAYGMAGTVALHANDPGFRFVLVHATDGGAGDIHPDFPATRESLGAIRRAEDERAWRALGRQPDRHVWLGYDDGALAEVPFEELVDRIFVLMEAERPDVVGTFGPDGITGHPDHVRIGAATDEAFDRVAAQPGPGLHRLVHGALPQSVFERWNETLRRKGQTPWEPDVVYHLRGVPDEQIGITVDTSSVAHRVVAGLRQHRSQRHVIASPDVTDEQWAHSTSREHYVLARPRHGADAPILADVFDGLPALPDESSRHRLDAD